MNRSVIHNPDRGAMSDDGALPTRITLFGGIRLMKDTVILVKRPGLGHTPPGEETFGVEMLDNFFHTLEKLPEKPMAICFYTEGVKLLAPDSPTATGIGLLERLGVRIVACGSCLDQFEVGPDLAAGQRGTMVEIVELIDTAAKVISI
jgi:intracellular sulfur oxidation DsrE/DsrF family protein